MSCRLTPERQPCTYRTALLRCAALLLALLLSLWLTACSSVSTPAIGATPPASGASSASSSANSNLVISSTLPAASVGAAYNASVTVTGGTAPYKFSLASGQLPSGILLTDASGAFSGTPSDSGNIPLRLAVTEAKG